MKKQDQQGKVAPTRPSNTNQCKSELRMPSLPCIYVKMLAKLLFLSRSSIPCCYFYFDSKEKYIKTWEYRFYSGKIRQTFVAMPFLRLILTWLFILADNTPTVVKFISYLEQRVDKVAAYPCSVYIRSCACVHV